MPAFGNGTEDIKLSTDARPRLFDFLAAYPHSSYWPKVGMPRQEGMGTSRETLYNIIFPVNNVLYLRGSRSALEKARLTLQGFKPGSADPPTGTATGVVEVRMLVTQEEGPGNIEPSSEGRHNNYYLWAGTRNQWPSSYAHELATIVRDADETIDILLTVGNTKRRDDSNASA